MRLRQVQVRLREVRLLQGRGEVRRLLQGLLRQVREEIRQGLHDSNEADKGTGESEYVSIVLEDLTINYFGAGMKIKKIKVRYKGQGIDAGDVAKDLSSIGRAAPTCCPMPCCVPAPCYPPITTPVSVPR